MEYLWIKRSKLGLVNKIFIHLWYIKLEATLRFGNDSFKFHEYSKWYTLNILQTNSKFRDYNAWYHIVVALILH